MNEQEIQRYVDNLSFEELWNECKKRGIIQGVRQDGQRQQ